ncbi:hypothetical protein MT391_20280, partial [Vibrio sp. 1-Bac 57]
MNVQRLRLIYLKQINEALDRLNASEVYYDRYLKTEDIYELDSCVLQLRKTLECIAFAAIAPNKKAYEKFRNSDFTKDFNAKKITTQLNMINENFYPIPLFPPCREEGRVWNYPRKEAGFLTKKRFEKVYDRLGKYLHSDNPWGKDKGLLNLAKEYPSFVKQIQSLLELHVTSIITPEFSGVW